MNHFVLGTDDLEPSGMILGFIGIGLVVLSWLPLITIHGSSRGGFSMCKRLSGDPLSW